MENWCFLLIHPTDIVLILVLKSISYGITSINHIYRPLEPQIWHPRVVKLVRKMTLFRTNSSSNQGLSSCPFFVT